VRLYLGFGKADQWKLASLEIGRYWADFSRAA
jgi:hypothetical protein